MREATPMPTPSTINPLRSLCARITSRAIKKFSPIRLFPRSLFITQRLDGIQLGCLHCRIKAEEEPNRKGHQNSNKNGPELYGIWQGRQVRHERGGGESHCDTENTTETGQGDGLNQELPENISASRAQRLAYADLARTFGHRDQHDVHDNDPSDHEADRDQPDESCKDPLADSLPEIEQIGGGDQGEVVIPLGTQLAQDAHGKAGLVDAGCELLQVGGLDINGDGT